MGNSIWIIYIVIRQANFRKNLIMTTTDTAGVERRAGLTRREFVREFVRPNRPVVFTDLTRGWRATGNYTPEYFRERVGDRTVYIDGKEYKLGEFITRLLASTEDNPAPYPCKLDLRGDFAELVPDVQPRPAVMNPDRTHSVLIPKRILRGLADLEIFLGGPGAKFPYLHYDYMGFYAFIHQMYGQKEFTVYSPEQAPYLYVNRETPWISDMENHQNPDLARYPLYKNAKPQRVVVGPGETMYIPQKWYHTARSLTPTISVASDQLCHFNWELFVTECTGFRKHSVAKVAVLRAYLRCAGVVLDVKEALSGGW